MIRIAYRCDFPSRSEAVPQLREFFARLRTVRAELGRRPYLNRLQRIRCRENLRMLEDLEREFHRIEYPEDFFELHQQLRRYLYLDSEGLAYVLGQERVERRSLFLL